MFMDNSVYSTYLMAVCVCIYICVYVCVCAGILYILTLSRSQEFTLGSTSDGPLGKMKCTVVALRKNRHIHKTEKIHIQTYKAHTHKLTFPLHSFPLQGIGLLVKAAAGEIPSFNTFTTNLHRPLCRMEGDYVFKPRGR